MSYPNAAMNAASNVGVGMLGNAVQGISNWNNSSVTTQAYQNPFLDKDQHVFNCTKVENGWTFVYRNKTHIASTVDEMMEMMKAAMVVERIEK